MDGAHAMHVLQPMALHSIAKGSDGDPEYCLFSVTGLLTFVHRQ